MKSVMASMLTRLAFIPVLLSGICSNMLFGIPMAQAMEPGNESASPVVSMATSHQTTHTMPTTDERMQTERHTCCIRPPVSHNASVATNNAKSKTHVSISTDLPRETFQVPFDDSNIRGAPHDHLDKIRIALMQTTIKRE
ncbi:hypothetical protein A3I45_02870 [Candidatus Uhrbacteria bacterium RIFCSPLOWO2_02_FULL_53_10]|uniref:Uncharacterized protein n=1 Tax=Candidatus Uhrbacteria bacterium RIFCSPLOWO2_02_FULL_53_10 TaxID=1802411 RepID=A0A1F7VHV1_9BACT|nr:MAG: hypothetical protein A3I45_02870 [Candidatus Uhrbacteria bacterium RIFCSPLOWO2_02_FULL_53_10]